jgi:meso-butanediol dehydrogenase/(S,S)-butanediol dehydrogenase/diacetyl reductase
MDQRFTGKTAIVTGASSGIGVGIARRLSAEGANVVVVARRKERLVSLVADLGEDRTLAFVTDISERANNDAMVAAALERFGSIDVLVCNAGISLLKPFEDVSLEEWHHIMNVDLDSCFHGAQAALPALKASGGNIVNIASASGLGGDERLTAYNTAKGAVVNFTRGLAFDLGTFGIRVNALAPALTLDEETETLYQSYIGIFDERRAIKGHSTPDDIGAAVAFLASEDARFITGTVLPIDGGITAGSGQPKLF